MKAIEILREEHRLIERVLTALEMAVARVERGEAVRPGFFPEVTDFVRDYADGCHHRKEEGVLFVAMTAAGMASQAGPIAVMLAEHEQARAFTRGLGEAAQRLQGGDPEARMGVIQNAKGYIALLRQHILKEDNILFPMAQQVIPPSEQEGVVKAFELVEREQIGEGVHERYQALAEKLEREATTAG